MKKNDKDISFKPVSKFNNRTAKTIALSVLLGGTPACTMGGVNPNNDSNNHNSEMITNSDSEKKLEYSILDVSFEREVANLKNPVGVVSAHGYYGSNQMSRFHAENIVLYGLLNPQYQELAKQFVSDGYDDALVAFQKEIATNGVNAYRLGNLAQRRLKLFIKKGSAFNAIHEKLGTTEPTKFLSLQRDYTLDVYANLLNKSIKDMEKYLPENAKLQDVDPMIIGMWMTTGIATGNLNGVADLTKNKTLAEINNVSYINAFVEKFPKVFKSKSGQRSVRYAKQNLGQGHSDITIKEVALLSNDPQIYDDYAKENARPQATKILRENVELKVAPITPLSIHDVKLQPLTPSVLHKLKKLKNSRS